MTKGFASTSLVVCRAYFLCKSAPEYDVVIGTPLQRGSAIVLQPICTYSSPDGFIGGGSHSKRPHPAAITSISNGRRRKITSDVTAALLETWRGRSHNESEINGIGYGIVYELSSKCRALCIAETTRFTHNPAR